MKTNETGFVYTGVALLFVLTVFFVPTKGVKAAGPFIPYSFFFENPYAFTGLRANVEVVDLDDPPGGVLIMNQYRVDINLFQNLLGIYGKFPFAGVVNFGPSAEFGLTDEEDDYNFGNIGVGAKLGLLNLDYLILTGGFEVIIPTVDDGLGAAAARAYFRDLPYFVDDAWTLNPYVVLGIGAGVFAFQANFGAEIITNADEVELEGDDSELRFKYGGTVSITPSLPVPFSTSFLLEALFVSTTSFEEDVTEVYLTPGIRLGGQIVSVGAGVQIPLGEDVDDFANANYFLDLVIRFGS